MTLQISLIVLPWQTAIQESQCWVSHESLLEAHGHWQRTQRQQTLTPPQQSQQSLQ